MTWQEADGYSEEDAFDMGDYMGDPDARHDMDAEDRAGAEVEVEVPVPGGRR